MALAVPLYAEGANGMVWMAASIVFHRESRYCAAVSLSEVSVSSATRVTSWSETGTVEESAGGLEKGSQSCGCFMTPVGPPKRTDV